MLTFIIYWQILKQKHMDAKESENNLRVRLQRETSELRVRVRAHMHCRNVCIHTESQQCIFACTKKHEKANIHKKCKHTQKSKFARKKRKSTILHKCTILWVLFLQMYYSKVECSLTYKEYLCNGTIVQKSACSLLSCIFAFSCIFTFYCPFIGNTHYYDPDGWPLTQTR